MFLMEEWVDTEEGGEQNSHNTAQHLLSNEERIGSQKKTRKDKNKPRKEDKQSPQSIQRKNNTIGDKVEEIIEEIQSVIEEIKIWAIPKLFREGFGTQIREKMSQWVNLKILSKKRAMERRRKYNKELEDIKHIKQEWRYSFKRVKGIKKDNLSIKPWMWKSWLGILGVLLMHPKRIFWKLFVKGTNSMFYVWQNLWCRFKNNIIWDYWTFTQFMWIVQIRYFLLPKKSRLKLY